MISKTDLPGTLEGIVVEMASRLGEIANLHQTYPMTFADRVEQSQYCKECGLSWPCPTYRIAASGLDVPVRST